MSPGSEESLRALLAESGLTQAHLAPLLGMTPPELARLLAGERALTKKHLATVRALRLLAAHDLIGAEIDARDGVGVEPLVRRFELLRNAAETAIADAKTISGRFTDAINWADLRCVRVFHWLDDVGDSGYTVEIEEASPDAEEFCRWIAESIEEDTGIAAQVLTEW